MSSQLEKFTRLTYQPRSNSIQARCNLRWNGVVAIVTELSDNPGMSITNAIEDVALAVCERTGIPFKDLVLIEHYPKRGVGEINKETFDLVTFDGDGVNPRRSGNTNWKRIAAAHAAQWIRLGRKT